MPTTTEMPTAAQVTSNMATFEPAPEKGFSYGTDSDSAHYHYWRKADGWIVIGPGNAVEFQRQVEKGMAPLSKYGRFLPTPKGWNLSRDPYYLIFANGGAKEFPLSQILESSWHRKPPYQGVVFPQLVGLQVGVDYFEETCPYCARVVAHESAERARLIMMRHENSEHREVSQNTKLVQGLGDVLGQMGEQQANTLALVVKALAGKSDKTDDLLAALAKVVLDKEEPDKRKRKDAAGES